MMERKIIGRPVVIGIILLLLVGVILVVSMMFRVNTIEYEGNTHYSNEELTNRIFKGKYNVNALVYSLFGHKKEKAVIPFIQDYEVEVLWPDGLKVYIYEKDIIGYISYMGCNMYFDRDGIIVDSSQELLAGVPRVQGLTYQNIVLHERLKTENDKVFSLMLDLSQLFEKYNISLDRVWFDAGMNITVQTGTVKVSLGEADMLTEKVHELNMMMPQLEGRTGTIYLNNYGEDTKSIIFKNEAVEEKKENEKN